MFSALPPSPATISSTHSLRRAFERSSPAHSRILRLVLLGILTQENGIRPPRGSVGPILVEYEPKFTCDHLVDRRLAVGDQPDRGDEVVDVGHPLLEQVAEPLAVALEQVERALDVDVGRE